MVNSSKNAIPVFVSLFLVVGLAYGSVSLHPVFAEPPDPCFGDECGLSSCDSISPDADQCCWTGPNGYIICQTCWVFEGKYFYCDPPRTKGKPDSSTIAPPPSGVAPPPSTQTCPENTALDANGNCAPVTQSPKEPKSSDDNKPSKPKLPKGGGDLEQPQTGESTAKKGNNDNSPTPPPCPDKGPIPPNCTLKPKF
jgi:hypothetical protein